MPKFAIRPLAWREINADLEYLEEHAGLKVAEDFLHQIIASCGALAQLPSMGVRCGLSQSTMKGLRRWPVKGFETANLLPTQA